MTSLFSTDSATSSSAPRGAVSPARVLVSLSRHRVELLFLLGTVLFALAVGLAAGGLLLT